MNQELPDVSAGFRKGKGTRDQIDNICWIIEKTREFQKNSYFCIIDYAKAFGSHQTMENSERVESTRPPYLYPEKPVCYNWTWNNGLVQNWERNPQGCILLPCLFNLHESTLCKMTGWMNHKLESRFPEEIVITSDMQMITTLMVESKEELKSLLMMVEEKSEKAGLKLNTQKTKIMTSDLTTSWQTEG